MVGGSDADVERMMPIFDTMRPDGDVADGFVHAGPVGAGHYATMVHNGIEYGLMMADAEGHELLAAEPLISASLFACFASRQDEPPTMKAVAALRNQFGGHAVKRVPLSG